MGKFFKGVVKFSVAAAAVGGLCYAFKDKIRESKVYQDNNVDEKINKVKTTIKDKMPKIFDNEDDIEEDDLFADDLDLEMEDANRDYVTITPDDSEKSEDAATEEPEKSGISEASEDAAEESAE
ncbi:MAG: hypothetical protein MR625_06630 [Clostridium sp.]|nr:hypothetical protein [Clostridium sp.]MDD7283968.1 hypothetical protein [Clostridium sp.]